MQGGLFVDALCCEAGVEASPGSEMIEMMLSTCLDVVWEPQIMQVDIDEAILISSAFGDITKEQIGWSDNEVVAYYVWDVEYSGLFIDANAHSEEQEAFIDDVIDSVDELVDLDFEEVGSVSEADLIIVSVDSYWRWFGDDSIVGEYVPLASKSLVVWRPTDPEFVDFDKSTIVHELGHYLGLSHPGERPGDPRYNTVEHTIMSYNSFMGQWGIAYTQNDIDALVVIWGVESDGLVVSP